MRGNWREINRPVPRSHNDRVTLSRLTVIALFALLSLGGAASQSESDPPKHLADARLLVKDLVGVEDNHYSGGNRHIDWDSGHAAARTVCSSFMTLLLQHSYGLTNDDFKSWMASTNPEAFQYHDAIAAKKGFKKIIHASALRPGDILAIKYTDHHVSRNGIEDTGHVMLVDESPQAVASTEPVITGMRQFMVSIIDSSASSHGPTDTRHVGKGKFTGGERLGTIA